MSTFNQAAVELIDRVGGLSVMARAVGVSRQAVMKWRVHGVPPARWDDVRKAFPRAGWSKLGAAKGRGRNARA